MAATGRITLTHFISQRAVSIYLFYGFGLGLYARLEQPWNASVCGRFWWA